MFIPHVLHSLPVWVQAGAGAVTVAAVAFAAVWAARAGARYLSARDGRNWETTLLLAFFAAAASLSAHGIIGFGLKNMSLNVPEAVTFWLALDGAAGMLLSMIRRRARKNLSSWHIRTAVWVLIGTSAAFNWLHAPHLPGAGVAYAAMPVIAGVLAELAVLDIRQEIRDKQKQADGRTVSRRIDAVRWLHPIEQFRVVSVMAADADLSAEDATRMVRADRAAAALYRLRVALTAVPETARDESPKHARPTSPRVRIAEWQAQAAFRRAGFAQSEIPETVLREMQVRVLMQNFAQLDYSTPDAAREAIAALINGKAPKPSEKPIPNPDGGSGRANVLSLPAGGGKKGIARKWWDDQIAAGTDPATITAKDLIAKAGLSENSSLGRQWRSAWLLELKTGDGSSDSDGQAEVSG